MPGKVTFTSRWVNFADYGKLSGRSLEDMLAGARIDINVQKDNPFDFALWKASKPGEPAWDSPWGPGRPGWHIECSAMSQYYLGDTFDIHGGGADLIFPHHENELAQSEAANDQPLARYWVHNGMITINQEKMSKSLGNFFTIQEVLAKFHPEVVRLFLIQNHYRSPLDFSDQALVEAESALGPPLQHLNQVGPDRGSSGRRLTRSRRRPDLPGLNAEECCPSGESPGTLCRSHGRRFQHGPGPGASLRHHPTAQPGPGTQSWTLRTLPCWPGPGGSCTILGGVLNLLQADPLDHAANPPPEDRVP